MRASEVLAVLEFLNKAGALGMYRKHIYTNTFMYEGHTGVLFHVWGLTCWVIRARTVDSRANFTVN